MFYITMRMNVSTERYEVEVVDIVNMYKYCSELLPNAVILRVDLKCKGRQGIESMSIKVMRYVRHSCNVPTSKTEIVMLYGADTTEMPYQSRRYILST